ncbi:hypothetical protein HIM_11088 [Hirsutella minnesotensis 3608]|uniref:Carrier domain-containing protein n=1 Tax=Hirsutella minnesotensis 3608 TaxID=1043627 RepID=A0A0F7ZFQ0_9HYPO|nr:hypothetical protein HIM_11088 [Hirsutella minnesotensis 3608]
MPSNESDKMGPETNGHQGTKGNGTTDGLMLQRNGRDLLASTMCVHGIIKKRALQQPEATAVCAWDGQLSYGELDVLSSAMAALLARHGVREEMFVPIYSEKSLWVPVAMLAVLKAGGAFVLLDVSYPTSRLDEICQTVGAKVIVASKDTAGKAAKLASDVVVADISQVEQAEELSIMCEAKPSNVAYAIFTSGTSGKPKGVAIEHQAFCSGVIAHAKVLNMDSTSRVLQFASYAFDACLLEMATALMVGACLCIPSEEGRKHDMAAQISQFKPNWMCLTPSVSRILDVHNLATVKTLVFGGEAVYDDDIRKWTPHLENLFLGYGLSECCVVNLVRLCRHGDEEVDSSNLGHGVGVSCWVVEPDNHDRLAKAGAIGELVLGGPPVGRGYINDPDGTARAFIQAPRWYSGKTRFYKTGDLVMRDPADGSIRFVGRKDTQVKFHGQRLEVDDIEHHLRRHLPTVRGLAVDIAKVQDSETLVAFVMQESDQAEHTHWLLKPTDHFQAQMQIIRHKLQDSLPKWMVPTVFLPLSSMPLTPNGKSDRRQLRAWAASLPRTQLQKYTVSRPLAAKKEPTSPTETAIQQLWASVLGLHPSDIGLQHGFFDLGGTSIDAMKLASAARKQGLELDLSRVYANNSLAAMAASVEPASSTQTVGPVLPFSLLGQPDQREAIMARVLDQCRLQDVSEIEDVYPCTPLQEGLVSLTTKRPGAYMAAVEYELPADADVHRFQLAWDAVVLANPILRTRFIQASTGSMYQAVIRGPLAWDSSLDVTWTDGVMGQQLVRLYLKSISGRHMFAFALHHALSDGWAWKLLLEQAQAAYDGATLAPRPFNCFIQHVTTSKGDYDGFWKEKFADLEAAVFPALPSAAYTPTPTRKEKLAIPIDMDPTARGEFSVPNRLRVAWGLLISLYTDNLDAVFGTTVVGRGASVLGVGEMTGPTIATIPCRLRLRPDMSIAQALSEAHKDYFSTIPFEQAGLQHIGRMGPEAASACRFQSLLVLQPKQESPPALFSAARDLAKLDAFSTYAITLVCWQLSGSIEVEATFDPDVVDETQLRRMLHQLRHIFKHLGPSRRSVCLSDVDTTSPEDWAELTKWNRTLPDPVYACAHDLIREQSQLRPDTLAVCAWDGDFTYRRVEELSSYLAGYLVAQGVGLEVFVPLCFEKSRWTTIAMLGVIKAGGAFILLDPSHPAERLRTICRDSAASLVLSSKKNAQMARSLASRCIVIGNDEQSWMASTTQLLVPNPSVTPENSIYAVFTSGSTGTPKGTVHSHSSWCTSAQANRIGLYLEPSSRVFQFAAYAFDVSIADHLLTLVSGGCICIPSQQDLQGDLAQAINRLNANWACLTPSIARIIDPIKTPTLKKLVLCGEPIASQVISLWSRHAHLLNVYGPAECAILTTLHRDIRDDRDPNNIAFPTSAVCWVVDAKNLARLAPIGNIGELLVEGPIVGHGYLNDPIRTAESFIAPDQRPPWLSRFRQGGSSRLYRTGDLVQYTSDGSLRYIGRKDRQIKLRGQRIELSEVEHHLRHCFPHVQDAAAEIVVRRRGNQTAALTAFILPEQTILKMSDNRFMALAAGAQKQLELLLPIYMVPTVFVPVNQFPYSKSGKLNRELLRSLAAELTSDEYKPLATQKSVPSSDEERILHELFAEVLKIPGSRLGIDDHFFRLGGDSLVAMHLAALAKDRGLDFSTTDIFQHPSVSSLAKRTRRCSNGVDHYIKPFSLIQRGTDRSLVEQEAMSQCKAGFGEIEDIYPCTPLQEGLMALTAKEPGKYIARMKYEIPRETDVTGFQRAWSDVLAANSILRTRIIESENQGLLQVVLKKPASWKVFGSLGEQQRYSEAQGMGLGSPLVHLSVAPLSDGSGGHQFLLTIHHSLYDGRSLELVWNQVEKAYKGEMLPTREFNRFIRHIAEVEGAEEFWTSYTSKLHAAAFPALPHDNYSPDPCQSFSFLVTGLPRSRSEYTLSTRVQLSWALMLSHYTGSQDVVFGLTSNGRAASLDSIADVTGPTIATVPVRVSLDLDKTVDTCLSKAQQQTLAMIPFLQYGLHRIRKLGRDAAKATDFQTHLVIQPPDVVSLDLGSLAIQDEVDMQGYENFASYALVVILHVVDGSDDLNVWVNFDPHVLEEAEARRMLEQFRAVLCQICEGSNHEIRDVQVISEHDLKQLAEWNGRLPPAKQETLHDLSLDHALTRPNADAVSGWDGHLSYRELDDWSSRLAGHFLSLGVKAESRVVVLLDKSCWSIVAILAILRAGGGCVLIDPSYPHRRIEQLISKARPQLVVASSNRGSLVQGLGVGATLISSGFVQNLPALGIKLPLVRASQAAFILFTSGSTGTPKAIVMEHVHLSTSILAHGRGMRVGPDSRGLHFASYAFDASIYEIFNTLIHGGCLCVPSEHDRFNNLAGFTKDQRVNWAVLTASTLNSYLPQDLPTLKTIVTGGEPVPRHVVDTWADNVTLINGYGPAEGTVCALGAIPAHGWRLGTIGHMVGSVGWIVDASSPAKLAAIGAIGELIIEGPVVTREYFEDPEKTAAAYIDPPGWLKAFRPNDSQGRLYKTGDLVKYNADGTIRFIGRKDTQVKLRGQRIELQEVEFNVRNSFPAADQVVAEVIASHEKARGPFLVAFIWSADDKMDEKAEGKLFAQPSKQFREMVQHAESVMSATVPSYMIPQLFLPLARLPLSPSQKVDRRQLREACTALSADEIQAYSSGGKNVKRAPPSTTIENTIHHIWARVLGVHADSFGVDDSFFRLGGDSISAMQCVAQCAAAGLRTSVAALFKAKTIRQLSLATEQVQQTVATPAAERIGEPFGLSPIQQMFFHAAKRDLNHFNKSLSLRVSQSVSPTAIQEAIEWIVTNHSMLRARFRQTSSGQWEQIITQDVAGSFLYKEDRAVSHREAASLVESDQRELDIQNGPLLICHVLVDQDDQLFLSLTAHHLVIDIVSWHIVLTDLEQLLTGQPLSATPSLPFQTWCRLQAAYAETLDPAKALPQHAPSNFNAQQYWGIRTQDNCWGDAVQQGFVLGVSDTQILLGSANRPFGTQPVEVLHAVLLEAFAQTFQDRPCASIFSEAHGREPWRPGIDITRTVGWFTTMWPAHVPVQPGDMLLDIVRKTKDTRRQVPSNGWAYFVSRSLENEGPIEILFNYNPGFANDSESLLQPVSLVDDQLYQISPVMPRFSLIDVLAYVEDYRLSFNFIFNKAMQSPVSRWIANTKSCLEAATSTLRYQVAALTLSDFPLLSYSYSELDDFGNNVMAALKATAEDIEDAYPCSPIQEGMMLSQAKDSKHYLNRMFWWARSRNGHPVRPEQLKAAWHRVLQKHPLLRTVVYQSPRRDGSHDQVVLKKAPECMCVVLPVCEDPLQRLQAHQFDMSGLSPPHRFAVCSSHRGQVGCLLEINHTLIDGFSGQLLLRDLCLAFDGKLSETPEGSYRDYVEYLQSIPLDEAYAYWQSYLESVEPCIFPASPPRRPYENKKRVHNFKLSFGHALRQFCAQQELTLGNAFQLAWALVLRLYVNADSVCFGYMAAGRDVPVAGIDKTIGPCINMLIFRLELGGGESVLDLLHRNQVEFVQSIAHQHLSVADKIKAANVSGSTLFNTLMSVQKESEPLGDESTLEIDELGGEGPTEYDVIVNIGILEKEIDVSLEYSLAFISDEQIENVADAFQQALLSMMTEPRQSARTLNLFGTMSEQRVAQYNQQEVSGVEEFVDELIQKQCRARPSALAVDAWDAKLTYGELDNLSSLVASELVRRGLEPDQFVPLLFEKSCWTTVALLGVLKAGGAFVLLDPAYPLKRLEDFCRDAAATLVLTSERNRNLATSLASDSMVICEQVATWGDRSSPLKRSNRDPSNAAYAMFTSGSTGKPKGVVNQHDGLATSAMAHGKHFLMDTTSRVLQLTSYAFDLSIMELVTTLIFGGCVCVPSDAQRMNIAKATTTMQANWVFLTPPVARTLNPSEFPTLKTLLCGGEAVDSKEVDMWRSQVNFIVGYGPTECAIFCSGQLTTKDADDGRILGRFLGSNSWVVSPENANQLLPVGSIGELLIQGPVVGRGYLNNPEKTAAAFLDPPLWLSRFGKHSSDRVYRTGDLVRYVDNGQVQYIARKDCQVKLRGQRVELGEVEYHLRQTFPKVKDVIADVIKPAGDDGRPTLMAFVYTGDHGQRPFDEMFCTPDDCFNRDVVMTMSQLDRVLPVYMVPTIFIPLARIPLTKAGKTDRRAVRTAAANLTRAHLDLLTLRSREKRQPSSPEEEQFQRIFADTFDLNADDIGMDDHFFRIGGDSLLAVTLILKAREAGFTITMADVFNHPKVSDLAAASKASFAASMASTIAPFVLIEDKETLMQLAAEQCRIPVDQVRDIYPCTPLQEGLVALVAKRPGHYIITFEYKLADSVDSDRFISAWVAVAAANSILRTRVIQADSGGFLQVVVGDSVSWQMFDDAKTCEEHIQAASTMGLGDPLVHFSLIRSQSKSGQTLSFHLTLHHALYDGSSLLRLWTQAQAAYNGTTLSPQPFNRFISYVLATPGAEAFWKSEFEGLTAPVFPTLPSSRYIPDPSAAVEHTITALDHGATEYTTSTAIRLALAIVLSCYTDSEDVLYGLTVNGRSAPLEGIRDITGPTFATFPVRTRVCRDDTVGEALAAIHRQTVASMPFQHFGMQYMRHLSPEAAAACDFQCHLAIQAPGSFAESELLADVRTKHEDYGAFANYAFVMVCHLPAKGESDLLVAVSYDSSVVHPLEATRIVLQFDHVLRQLVRGQSQSLSLGQLDLVSPQDRQQLREWNQFVPESHEACLHDLVLCHAISRPDGPAISAWDGDMTFRELDSASSILALQLQALGIQPGSLVPLLFDRSKWVVVAMLALHRAGAACVNIDPSHPRGRIQEILDATRAKFILTCHANQDNMIFDNTTAITVPIAANRKTARAKPLSRHKVSPHDAAFIIFTSGSTGKPKGIVMEHANLATSIRDYSHEAYLDQDTRGLHFASYAFDASIYEIFGVLVNGGCICIPSESARMNNVVPFVNTHKVNWTIFTPSFLTLLSPDAIPGVRTIMLGGEAITQENVDTWASKVNLISGYGPAEATICAVGPLPESGWKQGTLGRVTGGVGWITMPSDPDRLAPVGVPGELVLEGAVVTRGYIGDAEKTAAVYHTNPPWLRPFRDGETESRVYRSGDLVQYNQDGTIRYLGRRDTQVKLRGQRIELGEVEHHVRHAFPNVTDVAAEVVVPRGGGPTLMAFVASAVASQGRFADNLLEAPSAEFMAQAEAATRKIRGAVPGYMVPSIFVQLSEIPRTNSDKADRPRLREEAAKLSHEQLQALCHNAGVKRKPETEGEKLLQSFWAQVLKMPPSDIGADDDFFHLGGDSLFAMRLAGVARQYRKHLPVSRIFLNPVLSEQARVLENSVADGEEEKYRPGSLLGITNVSAFFDDWLADAVQGYSARDVEDLLPTTELQESLIRGKNITYSRLHLGTKFDPERLEAACGSLLRAHAILRTVFVPHDGEILQVILRDASFQIRRLESEEDIWKYSEKICSKDASSPVPFGSLHFQPFLVSRPKSEHMLVLRMTHAQYDAVSLPLLFKDLMMAYNGYELQSNYPPFAHYLRYRLSQDSKDAHEFWRNFLLDSEMTDTRVLCQTRPSTREETLIKLRGEVPLPCPPEGITLASLVKAAWSIVLARAAKKKDIVFGHIINGRDAPLQDVERISGPCITISPFRVVIQEGWTLVDLMKHVQAQYIRSMPFGHMDFGKILKNATEWSSDTDFGSVLTHQVGNLDLTGSVEGAKSQWQLMDLGMHHDFHVATWPVKGKLLVGLTVLSSRMNPDDVSRAMDEFCQVMADMSLDPLRPLQLEAEPVSESNGLCTVV